MACKMRNSRDICRSLKKLLLRRLIYVLKNCVHFFEQNSDDDNLMQHLVAVAVLRVSEKKGCSSNM